MQKNTLHIATSFFTLSTYFIFFILGLSGCEDKKSQSSQILVENTTELFTTKDKNLHAKKRSHTSTNNTYILKDNTLTHRVTLKHREVTFHDMQTPVVMLRLYTAECSLCLLQEKPLNKLEKSHSKNFSILSVLENGQNKELNNFSNDIRRSLGLSEDNTLALNVIYRNGKYYSHFEGSVPIEMISHDIVEAIKK